MCLVVVLFGGFLFVGAFVAVVCFFVWLVNFSICCCSAELPDS